MISPTPPTSSWRLGLLLLLALLQACAIAPPALTNSDWRRQRAALLDLEDWQMRGRVNVRYEGESHTPRIQWQQQAQQYRIRLWGTFNAGNTLIEGKPGSVVMTQGSDVLTASSPKQLILDQLGYELPVSLLEYWVRGLPAPRPRPQLNFNELNQLASIEQAGWTVQYSDPRLYDGIVLPRRIEVSRPENDIQLRFVGLSWELQSAL